MLDSKNHWSDYTDFFVTGIDYDTHSFWNKFKYAAKIVYSPEAKQKIAKLLHTYKPDLVHLHIFQHQLSASILPEIKKRKIPIVYTAHDLKSICPNYKMLTQGRVCELCRGRNFYHCFLNRCTKNSAAKSLINVIEMYVHNLMDYYKLIDLVITPSSFYRDKLIQYRFPKEKVVHLANFVDVADFEPLFEPEPYFLFFGRLAEEKGITTLVQAMQKVMSGKLLIAGSGPMDNKIRQIIDKLGLTNIDLVGFQNKLQLRSLIQKSMFTILPSEWYENGPMSLLESFAYGKSVIGSNIGGIPEHIDNGLNGLLFEPKDPDELSDKINWMMDNRTRTIEMGREARKKAESHYSKKLHMQKILEIYNKVCKN